MNEIAHRLNRLTNTFEAKGLDGLLITNVSNVRYLSSFSGDASAMIIHKHRTVFFTDERYIEQARQECSEQIEVRLWYEKVRFGVQSYQKIIDEWQIHKLGFEANNISYADYNNLDNNLKNVQLNPVVDMVEELRMIKTREETDLIAKACNISDRALEKTVAKIKRGNTEKEVTALLEYNLRMEGADNISFETIVLTGKRTSLLHGKPSNVPLQEGDYLLFDFGALLNEYHADISRTFVIGKPNEMQMRLYDIIYNCQQSIIKAIKHNLPVQEINEIIKNIIPEEYMPYYYPGYGHGVGLDIHERPFMRDTADFTFEAGMVVTVEPGIYIPGWSGLRIEDTVLVTENGSQALSNYPREMISL